MNETQEQNTVQQAQRPNPIESFKNAYTNAERATRLMLRRASEGTLTIDAARQIQHYLMAAAGFMTTVVDTLTKTPPKETTSETKSDDSSVGPTKPTLPDAVPSEPSEAEGSEPAGQDETNLPDNPGNPDTESPKS